MASAVGAPLRQVLANLTVQAVTEVQFEMNDLDEDIEAKVEDCVQDTEIPEFAHGDSAMDELFSDSDVAKDSVPEK